MRFRIAERRCTGCQLCQLACSSVKEGTYSLRQARLRVSFPPEKKEPKIVVCRQCRTCKCIKACPYGAFKREERTGAVTVDFEGCQACYACLDACPFGAVALHPKSKLPAVCDLCGGRFPCVAVCGSSAIRKSDALSGDRAVEEQGG